MNRDGISRLSRQRPPKPATYTPPRNECLLRKDPHLVSECPTSSNAQKDEAKRAIRERMVGRASAKRAKLSSDQDSKLPAVLAGNLEVLLCADSGSDVSIIPRSLLLGLPLDTNVATTLRHPVSVKVVGGATLVCRKRVPLEVQVRTAA